MDPGPQNTDLLTFGYYAPDQRDKLVKGLGHGVGYLRE
jgi:hypothetical protein